MDELKVKEWFEGEAPDYMFGVSLLANYCGNKRMIANLMKKESTHNWEKLRYELGKYVRGVVTVPFKPVAQPAKAPSKVEDKTGEPPSGNDDDQYPDDVKELITRQGVIFRDRAKCSNMLHTFQVGDNIGRKREVQKISAYSKEYNAIAEDLRYYANNGELPKKQAPKELKDYSDIELTQLRDNMRSNISKTKKKIDKSVRDEIKHLQFREVWERQKRELEAVLFEINIRKHGK